MKRVSGRLAIVNAHVISPSVNITGATVVVEKGRIRSVSRGKVPQADEVFDARGAYLMPGFIDVHTHGAAGYDFCDADPEAIFRIAEAKLSEGVTTFLPTTLTVSKDELKTALRNARNYNDAGSPYAKVPGVHLEGPYIDSGHCGAQNPAYVRRPSVRELDALRSIFPVRLITFAPEVRGGLGFVSACLRRGVVPSCGHTAATVGDVRRARAEGLRHLTHFCNQMMPLHHREIGVVGAGFLYPDLETEVICDRIHLCDDMLRLVFTRRDLRHVQIITDSLRCSHCPDGYSFTMGGLAVRLEKGEARLVKDGHLAGSTLWMGKGLKNVHDVTGLPLEELVRTTSLNQALEQGWKDLGRVEKGYRADFVVIDPRSWRTKAVFVDGERRI